MSDAKRLILVGCGTVAELYHAPALRQSERAGWLKVAALVDPSPERRATLRTLFPYAKEWATMEDVREEPELAIVASPVLFHAQQTAVLLEQGCTVLCEKPLCRTPEEACVIQEAAARSGRQVLTGFFRRFFPATEQIRNLASAEGPLGRPLRFSAEVGGSFAWPAVSTTFFDRESAGGGVLMDIGSHNLDLLTWWFGEVTDAEYWDDAYGGVECNAFCRLRFAGGVEGTLRLSWDLPTTDELVIEFERGCVRWATGRSNRLSVSWTGSPYALAAELHKPAERRPLGLGLPGRGYLAAFTEQLRNLLEVAEGLAEPRASLDDGVRNLRLIRRLYAARKVWCPSWFTPDEAQAASRLAGGER